MRNRTGIAALGMVAMIVLAFSVAAFFLLDIEKIALYIWALIFLLFSECIMFGGLILLRLVDEGHSTTFLKVGVTAALGLYFIATFIGTLCASFFVERFHSFILVELGIMVFFAIVIISITSFSRRIQRSNEEDAQKVKSTEARRGGF